MTNREKPPAILITLLHEVRQLRAQVDRLAPRNRPVENPADDPAEALRMQCEARGITVSIDGYVREVDAAAILGLSRSAMKNRRLECRMPIQHRKLLGRIEYSLADISEMLIDCREDGWRQM